jgi:hypothetical protein
LLGSSPVRVESSTFQASADVDWVRISLLTDQPKDEDVTIMAAAAHGFHWLPPLLATTACHLPPGFT